VLGETREVGLKGATLDRFLTYSVTFYRQYLRNAAFAWSNPSGFTTTGTGAANDLQTLLNPIGLSPTDPSYFNVAQGLNSEDHNTSSNQKSKGMEWTLQLQRMHGFQVLLSGDINKLSANRDFSELSADLQAVLKRQAAYLAAGQAGYATGASGIGGLQTLLANNAGISDVGGIQSRPYQANLLVDYAVSAENFLKGTEFGVGGNYTSKYNLVTTANGDLRGDAELPVTAFVIRRQKLYNKLVTFRLGVTHLVDLLNLHRTYRTVGVTTNPSPGVPANYQFAYFQTPTVTFTTSVNF
jgi:hypothetical protein